jgi:hypothetical protein
MAEIKYTPTEELLLGYSSHMRELDTHEIEDLADSLDRGIELWVAIELGRCPSTDMRTYILHTYYQEPKFDYYGAELISLKSLKDN